MDTQVGRIRFLDVMRGVAVVVMVMGHSIDSVLSVDVRSTELFRLYDAVRGFTAPIFLFVAGYAFMVGTEKRWGEYRRVGAPVLKRLSKAVLLLVVGYALHVPFFSFAKVVHSANTEAYVQFYQADVLHCVAVSLLILQAIVFMSNTPKRFARVLSGVGLLIVLVTPLMWLVDFTRALSPVVAPYLSQRAMSIFPLFPFAAFLFAGAVAGHYYLRAQIRNAEREYFRRLIVAGFVLVGGGLLFALVPPTVYPPHDFWKASPLFFAIRLGIVLLVTVGLYSLKGLPVWTASNLVRLGQASLLIYVVHLLVVYGSAANDGLMQRIGQNLPFYQAVGVGLLVLLAMLVLVRVRDFLRLNYHFQARFIQAATASMLLIEFFRRPW